MFTLLVTLAPFLANGESQPASGRILLQVASNGLVSEGPAQGLSETSGSHSGDPDGEFTTKAEPESDLGQMMKQMMHDIDSATGQDVANGTSAAMKSTVDSMMAKFATVAQAKFKKAFDHSQTGLKTRAAELTAANKKAVSGFASANTNHVKLGACRAQEKVLLQAFEEASADGVWANKTAEKACEEKQEAQVHDWNVAKELTSKHKCDLGEAACPKLEELKKHLDEHYAQASKMRDQYKTKSQACENTRKAADTQEKAVQAKSAAFQTKKAACDQADFTAKASMCTFGTALQQKCERYSAMTDLIVKVRDGKDTSYSEADRQTNWVKAMTLKCQLASYTGNGGVDESVKKLCESDVNYETDIGIMDYQSAAVNGVVRPSPPNFNCDEKQIMFTGSDWSTGNSSSMYKEEAEFKPELVLLPVGEGAFNFCQSNNTRATCRGFTCDAPAKLKATAATVGCALVECTPYECCDGGAAAPAKKM